MEMNFMMVSQYAAIETGGWLISFVQYLAVGAGLLFVGGICAVLYENVILLRKGALQTATAEIQGFGPSKEHLS